MRLKQLSRNILSNRNAAFVKICLSPKCVHRFVGLLSAVEPMQTRRIGSQLPRGTSQLMHKKAQKASRSLHFHNHKLSQLHYIAHLKLANVFYLLYASMCEH